MLSLSVNNDVAHAIQLAVTPAFLLTSIAGLLNMLTSRLARVIDRYRTLDRLQNQSPNPKLQQAIFAEQRLLDRRGRAIHRAIALCTASAIFTCLVIVLLFLDSLFALHLNTLLSVLFIISSLMLLFGLIDFINEIRVATRSIYSITNPNLSQEPKP